MKKIKAFVKRCKFIYNLYYYVGSCIVRIIGLFVKTDPNLVLFISYGGKKYDDSPKVVYEYLLNNPISSKHHFVWAFEEPEVFPEIKNKVKVDTLSYYLAALRAGYWISNSSASRGLNFRKKKTKNFMYQHGMVAIKKIGVDIQQYDKAFRIAFHENFDAVFVEGLKEIPILSRAWQMDSSVFLTTGLPRNDDLAKVDEKEILRIKALLGIPSDKKVILYAPTFREFSCSGGENSLGIPIDFRLWEKVLGKEYVLLITAHYEVAKLINELPENDFIFNVFKYPVLNDLLKVSDILISDYSSVVFDYSILERPILCYGYDYDDYVSERGVYTDLDTLFSNGVLRTELQLLEAIVNIDYKKECIYTKKYIKDEYIASYGDAAKKSIDIIFSDN